MYFFYFYPLGLDLKRGRRPVLTTLLLLFMAGLFLWTRYWPWEFSFHPYRLIFFPGNEAPWTVLTAIFMHVGWLHILGNMVYLWVFAPMIEDRLGRVRLLYYFLMLGMAGNVLHGYAALHGWFGSHGAGVMGASGAIAGLLAFCLVRFYFARVELAYWVFAPLQGINRVGRAYLPVPVAVFLWLLLQVAHVLYASETGAAVSYGAHFGGFALGLFLAFFLGYHRQASAESHLVAGRRYLDKGKPYAAEGAFIAYLATTPDDLECRLQLARARNMTRQFGAASSDYRWAFRQYLAAGDIEHALTVYQEARRGNPFMGLTPDDLARVAFYLEKKLDFLGAVEAHLDLYRQYPTDTRADLAMVRAIMLTRSELGDGRTARQLLAAAWRDLKAGVWRDFLAQEFNLAEGPHERPPEEWPDFWPEPVL